MAKRNNAPRPRRAFRPIGEGLGARVLTATGIVTPPIPIPQLTAQTSAALGQWSVSKRGDVLEIAYGRGSSFPQYGALDLRSGYLRLIPGPTSGWSTSIVLPPALWTGGIYHQGAAVKAVWSTVGTSLVIKISGSIAGLNFTGQIQLQPPTAGANSITAQVTMNVTGRVALDRRPGEAFKIVSLSSMHVSDQVYDARRAFVDGRTFEFPRNGGWIVQPAVLGRVAGLEGGSSQWKNGPTIEVQLDRTMPITGWRTLSPSPDDDGIHLWPASDQIVNNYSYRIISRKPA
jgi:hypothetical protein